MKSKLQKLAEGTARRTIAAERVVLRRWLRRKAASEDRPLPDHLYLTYDLYELCDEVRRQGGDPTQLRAGARVVTVKRILGGA